MERLPFTETRVRAKRPMEKIHTDIMGPIKPLSYPGANKYIITFIDDYSRYAKVYCIGNKSQAGECLEDFLQKSRNLIGKELKTCFIQADNAKEYTGGKFEEVMKAEKIDKSFAPEYTPQHNGVAERLNKTLQFKIRAYLLDSGLPSSMWSLASEAAVHIYNRTPHKANNFESPLKLFAPEVKHHIQKLKRFGCLSYVHIPNPERKFGARALKTVLVGYTRTGYLLWHPTTRIFLNSRNVNFNEKLVYKEEYKEKLEVLNQDSGDQQQKENQLSQTTECQNQNEEKLELETEVEFLNSTQENTFTQENLETKNIPKEKAKRGRKRKIETQLKLPLIPTKVRVQPSRKPKVGRDFKIYANVATEVEDTSFAFFTPDNLEKSEVKFGEFREKLEEDEMFYCLLATINKDPSSYQEAMSSPDQEFWQSAVDQELDSMLKNEVWTLVDKPTSRKEEKKANIIDSKWVFKKKIDESGEIKFKARLVIRGFKDRKEYELKETYAPVSRLPLIRAVLAIANKLDLDLHQMDVKTAFLNGELEESIYMEIPEGFKINPSVKQNKICKLQKALYGLRISPKRWNLKFTKEIQEIGLENSLSEPCLYTWRKEGKLALIVLYVDDMLIASNDPGKILEIKRKLNQVFEMKDLGEPKLFLGMKIKRDRKNKEIQVDQGEYTERILERFNMKNCTPKTTPMETRQVHRRKFKINEEKEIRMINYKPKVPYREAIGSLLYLAGGTRPDIAYTVNVLSRRQVSPTAQDWEDVKRLFQYLRGTTNLGLVFKGNSENLEAKTDTSFNDWTDSTSTSGYLIQLYGDTIAWRSHKQAAIYRSTSAAEYAAMSEACREIVSLDKALREITGETFYPVTIYCDNQAACKNTQMEGNHKLCDFDDKIQVIQENLRFRENTGKKPTMSEDNGDYVKYLVNQEKINVKWITTKMNAADIFTKPLEFKSHEKFTKEILNQKD